MDILEHSVRIEVDPQGVAIPAPGLPPLDMPTLDMPTLDMPTLDMPTLDMIENRTFDELAVGDTAQIVRTLTQSDIELFANVSGDVNPTHLDRIYAEATKCHGLVAHGMLGGSLFSTVLGTMLPGAGTVYRRQDLHFRRTVKPGDTLTARVVVREKHADEQARRARLRVRQPGRQDGHLRHRRGDRADREGAPPAHGAARGVGRPPRGLRGACCAAPPRCRRCRPPIVHPCDRDSLAGALEAAAAGFIDPILVGPEAKIRAVAAAAGLDLAGVPIVDAPNIRMRRPRPASRWPVTARSRR